MTRSPRKFRLPSLLIAVLLVSTALRARADEQESALPQPPSSNSAKTEQEPTWSPQYIDNPDTGNVSYGDYQTEDATVLLEKQTLYHYIRVTECGSIRRLHFRRNGDENEESAIDVNDPLTLHMGYYRAMFAGYAFQTNPKRILLIGLGGGALSTAAHSYFKTAQVDNIELDPDVVAAAKDYFGFKEDDRMTTYTRDGRVQVRQLAREKKQYDVILVDAFRGGYIPYHLTTREFMTCLKKILAPEGVVVSNLRPGFASYHYHRRTLAASFTNEWAFPASGNVVVVTSMHATPPPLPELVAAASRLQNDLALRFDLQAIVAACNQGVDYERQGPILTDDFAPTDVLRSIPQE